MYNHVRRCLVISVNLRRQFLTQSIPPASAPYQNDYYANACRPRNDAACKRFYCQPVEKSEEEAPQEEEKSEDEKPGKSGNRHIDSLTKMYEEYQSNPETKKRLQILELEVDVLRHNAGKVPEVLRPKDWVALERLPTKSQRMKHLRFLWRNERITANLKAAKEQKRAQWMATKEAAEPVEDTGEMKYGLQYNSLFVRIYPTTMAHGYNCKLMQAIMFEPKIVIDCGYEENMNYREVHNCAKQLQMSFAANRAHVSPLHLHFCCLKKGGLLEEFSYVNIPSFLDVDFPATVTSQSYLDLFPRDQLVYLTPHCRAEMTEYDPDLVYIIGAIVDKVQPQPLSLAKAKKEGIRMLKLPVDKYLEWGSGSGKSFTINQMMKIMLDLRHTGDWNLALQNVPSRKLKAAREYSFQRKLSRSAARLALNARDGTEESKRIAVPTDPQRTQTQTNTRRTYSDSNSESGIRDFRFSSRKKNVS
ncbi:hypothetical protein DMN91_012076 [Ooceraea biroi]|uniref:RNA (guanine-9-)-methyltransferase domain-containing protein 1 n=1 Tax=Ooceraea biroi TaxID=2015173 RepID=A0A026W9T4_OOCBI|nr:mitochondrial ribonuclease P protein 1 homolog [Ooceraea biroi]EZA52426.1 Mitochondrial ribonuclease P protein 1-like protein [Ooceraea biroi]RLU16316.1 hypothetical protein DMN91_012076 [Ooceraea biroi]